MLDVSPRAMSKRVFGVGIISVGLLVLTVALILGLEFPKYVFEKNVENVCILNRKHKKYEDWVADTYRDRHNKIYYWVLTNADSFLYNRATPKVEQRGPYVYRESLQKLDVQFVMSTVRFVEWKQQTFDEVATRKACPNCTENDKLTVINPHFLRRVEELRGDVQYTLHVTPGVLATTLNHITALQKDHPDMSQTMVSLGQLNQDPTDQWREVLGLPEGFSHLGFGNWVGQADTPEKNVVLRWRSGSDFSSREMTALYFVLTNSVALGVSKNAFTNETFIAECQHTVAVPNYVTYQIDLDPGTLAKAPDNVAVTSAGHVPSLAPCGLVSHLRRFRQLEDRGLDTDQVVYNLTETIGDYLCPNLSTACLSLPPDLATRKAFVRVLADYVLLHLLHFVFHKAVILAGDDLVSTRGQRELALGYFTANSSGGDSQTAAYFLPGILDHATSAEQARHRNKQIELVNCYASINAETNFMWSSYDHKRHASEKQFPAAPARQRRVYSYRHHMQPLKSLAACATYDVRDEVEVFVPEFWRRVLFSRRGASSLAGVSLDKLQFNASNIEQDDTFVSTPGLQEMTATNGYKSWVGLPHYLYANDPELAAIFDMAPTEDAHTSFIEWEPMGGELWLSTLRHQHSVGVLPRDLEVVRSHGLALNYTDLPIPAYWLHQHFRYSDKGIKDFKHRVTRLMNTSCGGLVGLTVVAVLIMILGVLAGSITIRSGKVAPITDDLAAAMR